MESDKQKLLRLKRAKVRYLKYEIYKKDPLLWLEEVFGESRKSFVWSLNDPEKYETHNWDGDKDPIAEAWMQLASGNLVALKAATGCHAKGTEVIKYDGSIIKVEEVREGDFLMGDDSTKRKVLSLARGRQKMYRVQPIKGEAFVCNEDHILSLKKTPTGVKYKYKPQIVNVTIKDYLKWNKHDKHLYKLYRVGVSFRSRPTFVEPYFMGAWIGDGTRTTTTITNVDEELITYLHEYADRLGAKLTIETQKNRTSGYRIHFGLVGKKGNPILRHLNEAYINDEKRIPKQYLVNSRKKRLELLAGLIDTDGTNTRNTYSFATIYKGLADDVCYLCRSLGFSANYRFKANEHKGCYILQISGERLTDIPLKITRKKVSTRKQQKDPLVTGFTLEELPEDNYYGFQLDGNNLYLLKDFTVTHNTGKTYALSRIVCWFTDCYEDSLIVTTAPSETQLKTNLWGEIQKAAAILKRRARPFLDITSLRLYTEFHNKELDTRKTHLVMGEVSSVKNDQESAVRFQGYHRKAMLIILEEAAGVPHSVVTAALNTLDGSTTNLILAVGNPDNELDQLHTFAELEYVKSYRISAMDHPNVVRGETIFHGAVTQNSIYRRLVQYGEDSPLYLSRVRGITPNEASNTLIRKSWVEAAFTDDPDLELNVMYNAVGVDVSNSEQGDKAALAYGKGAVLKQVYEFQCPNASHLAYNLLMDAVELANHGYQDFNVPTIQEMEIIDNCVGIDTVGVGASTMNVFENLGLSPLPMIGGADRSVIPYDERINAEGEVERVLMYDFFTGRDQWYWELREDLRLGKIRIHITDPAMRKRVLLELCTPRFVLDRAKIQIESKTNIKKRLGGKSPNVADAIVYWNWARKGYRFKAGLGINMSAGT